MIETDYPYRDQSGAEYLGFVAAPDEQRRPVVLIGHDWSGLNEGIKAIARKVADCGYLAFAMDVYGAGVRGDELGDNSGLMAPLMEDRALLRDRLLAAHDAASRHPLARSDRMGVLGYCFGGLCALDLARANPAGLLVAVSVHGVLTPPLSAPPRKISAGVLVLHGWEDPIVSRESLLDLASELTDAGTTWEFRAYGHAMHAFTFEKASAPEAGICFHAEAASRSWKAILEGLGVLGS